MDFKIFNLIEKIRFSFLNTFFLNLTWISSSILIFIFLTVLFLSRKSRRKLILPLWLTFATTVFIVAPMKYFISRLRPYQLNLIPTLNSLIESSHLTWDYSFPSFHAALAFSSIPFLNKEFPKFKWLWISLAILISFSRIYFGLHFPTDVFFGAIIGYSISKIFLNLEQKHKFTEKIISFLKSLLKRQ